MKLIPNPSDVRYVETLRGIVDLIRTLPEKRRDIRSLANILERSQKVLRNQIVRLEAGGVLARSVARVSSGAEAFVFSIVTGHDEIEAFLHTVLMQHARPAGQQRHAIRMPGVSPNKGKPRPADATARAIATVALKAALRKAPSTAKRDWLVAALFGAGPAVHV